MGSSIKRKGNSKGEVVEVERRRRRIMKVIHKLQHELYRSLIPKENSACWSK